MAATGKTEITPEKLDEIVIQLKVFANSLTEVAEGMRRNNLKKLAVMNQPAAKTGLKSFQALKSSCESKLQEAILDKMEVAPAKVRHGQT